MYNLSVKLSVISFNRHKLYCNVYVKPYFTIINTRVRIFITKFCLFYLYTNTTNPVINLFFFFN